MVTFGFPLWAPHAPGNGRAEIPGWFPWPQGLSLLEEPSQPLQHLQLRQLVSTKIFQRCCFKLVGAEGNGRRERERQRNSHWWGWRQPAQKGMSYVKDTQGLLWEFLITSNNTSTSSCFSPRCNSGWEIPWTKDPSFYIPKINVFGKNAYPSFYLHAWRFLLSAHSLFTSSVHIEKQSQACHSQICLTQFSSSWACHNDNHLHQLSSRNWIKLDIFLKPPSSQAVPWEAPPAQPPAVLIRRSSEERISACLHIHPPRPDSTEHYQTLQAEVTMCE